MSRRRAARVACATVPFALVAAALFTIVPTHRADAYSTGISGRSGNPAAGGTSTCEVCHSLGIAPTVTLTGPTSVAAGSLNTYSLRISGGQHVSGGLDVSVTGGTLGLVESGTQVLSGEITHTSRKLADGSGNVTFNFKWTAPATVGTVTMFGAGLSADSNGSPTGDAPNKAQLPITVTAATPGETSGATIAPLLVTGYEKATGAISLSYGAACAATDNSIHYGPLSAVSTLSYSGSTCSIGNSGSYSGFNPGGGSFFFLVVGDSGTKEGSYGLEKNGGASSERPPFSGNACAVTQDLSARCD